jgi:hypothetical protein
MMARDVILGLASYERRAIIPKGYLWSDHAISERVFALVDFWAMYRHHPSYRDEVAKDLLLFAARSGKFLSDPAFFVLLSNHGVMQNLALWHLSLAFPSLPDADLYSTLAFERLSKLMEFYVNEEGFILEHSAGYHKTGVQFLSMAFRYMSLLRMQVPVEWQQRFSKAVGVYARLSRPDGSWPMFGDTEGGADLPGPLVPLTDENGFYGPLKHRAEPSRNQTSGLYPVAGYSVWWNPLDRTIGNQELSQTVVAWSYFRRNAHKHADEMSVLLWAGGLTWWTNVGYWPYGTDGRNEAESWNGSNAPHLTGETASSSRRTRMLGHASAKRLAFIDLERRGPQEYVARRQVARATNNLWVVIDHTEGNSSDRTSTLWTTSHDVQLSEGQAPGSYDLRHASNKLMLSAFIFGSEGTSIRRYKGSREPFAGWQMAEEIPKPAPAIMIEQPANHSWSVTVWSLDATTKARKIQSMPSMTSWKGPENWMVSLPMRSGTMQLSRDADKVSLKTGRATRLANLTLARQEGIEQQIEYIQSARERVRKEYPTPRFQDATEYRYRATYLAIVLLILQEAFFAVYKRFTQNHYLLLRGLSGIAWIVVGIWLVVRIPLL